MHLRTSEAKKSLVTFVEVDPADILEDVEGLMDHIFCSNLDSAAALSMGIDGHEYNGTEPTNSVFVRGLPDYSLHGMVPLQFEVEMLQTAGLGSKEREEITPISLRATVYLRMVWELHSPSEPSNAR